jgi:L-fuconolactonase
VSNTELSLGARRAAWRACVREDVLWPTQRICDPHHHLWGHADDEYYAAQLAADIGDGHQVLKTIYVECEWAYRSDGPVEMASVGETEFVVAQDEILRDQLGHSVIAGIIAFADLRLGANVRPVLDAHREAGRGRFCGVRHSVAWDASPDIFNHHLEPPPHLLLDPQFVAGVRTLGEQQLCFDVWAFHNQLSEVTELARRVPGTTIVLDHLGAPLGVGPYAGRREEVLAHCRTQLQAFAALPNARLKLGGIGMTTYGNGWHKQAQPPSSLDIVARWGDFMRWCIDCFGPNRVMFESNFPPDHRSCSYRTLWNAYKRIAEPYNQAERDLMFHDTAVATYRL